MAEQNPPPLPEDNLSKPPLPPMPPPSTQMFTLQQHRVDFESDEGRQITTDTGEPEVKRLRLDKGQGVSDSSSWKMEDTSNETTSNGTAQSYQVKLSGESRDGDSTQEEGEVYDTDENEAKGSDALNGCKGNEDSEEFSSSILHMEGAAFEIIDDAGSDGDDQGMLDSDEEDFDMEEIEAMLEEGYQNSRSLKGGDGSGDAGVPYEEKEKVVLKELGHDPLDILPDGWVKVSHNSGMPVYLHKQSRVCTLSRPYFLGPGSARKHDIPLSAIPCLQYRRQKEHMSQKAAATQLCKSSEMEVCDQNQTDANTKQEINNTTSQDESQNLPAGSEKDGVSSNLSIGPVPDVQVMSAEQLHKATSLGLEEVRLYCESLFEFKTVLVKRFKTWKDKRSHHAKTKKSTMRPALPSSMKLITCPVVASGNDQGDQNSSKKREFLLNTAGKSEVCVLHEYVQHVMKQQPKYIFKELENAQTPFSATVVIGGVEYGTGYASSKKAAKSEAAKVTLGVLLPEMNQMKEEDKKKQQQDFSFFDSIKIEDPRVHELCNKSGQPSPFQILQECLKRNYGMGNTHCHMEATTLKHQKSEFTMKVGKHEATVISKNKREGKQQAAQAILQRLHPHVHSWGSLLRLYQRGLTIKEKRDESDKEDEDDEIENEIPELLMKLHMATQTDWSGQHLFHKATQYPETTYSTESTTITGTTSQSDIMKIISPSQHPFRSMYPMQPRIIGGSGMRPQVLVKIPPRPPTVKIMTPSASCREAISKMQAENQASNEAGAESNENTPTIKKEPESPQNTAPTSPVAVKVEPKSEPEPEPNQQPQAEPPNEEKEEQTPGMYPAAYVSHVSETDPSQTPNIQAHDLVARPFAQQSSYINPGIQYASPMVFSQPRASVYPQQQMMAMMQQQQVLQQPQTQSYYPNYSLYTYPNNNCYMNYTYWQ